MYIESFQIGITDYCNLRCIHCGQNAYEGYGHPGGLGPGVFHDQKKGFMDIRLYQKILDDIQKDSISFNVFNFFWFGEQLLHPQAADFIEMTFQYQKKSPFFNHFWIHTNATLLNRYTEILINKAAESAQFSRLYFSLDAADEDDFLCIKKSSDYCSMENAVKQFIRRKKESNLDNPQLVLGFIVLPENRKKLPAFLEKWKKYFEDLSMNIEISINSPHQQNDCLYIRVAYLPEQAKYEKLFNEACIENHLTEVIENDRVIQRVTGMQLIDEQTLKPQVSVRPPCPAPFRTMTVNWDGQLAACCSDYEFEIKLPSLAQMSVAEAWNSEPYLRLRSAHLKGDLSLFPRCEHCGNLDCLPLTEEEISLFGSDLLKLWKEREK